MKYGSAVPVFVCLACGVGLVFVCVAGLMLLTGRRRKRRCTNVTVGSVVDYAYTSYNPNSPRTWHAVFAYTANGVQFRRASSYGTTKRQFAVGQRVTVHYDPQDPNVFDIDEVRTGRALRLIFLSVGLGLLVLGLAIWLCLGR